MTFRSTNAVWTVEISTQTMLCARNTHFFFIIHFHFSTTSDIHTYIDSYLLRVDYKKHGFDQRVQHVVICNFYADDRNACSSEAHTYTQTHRSIIDTYLSILIGRFRFIVFNVTFNGTNNKFPNDSNVLQSIFTQVYLAYLIRITIGLSAQFPLVINLSIVYYVYFRVAYGAGYPKIQEFGEISRR